MWILNAVAPAVLALAGVLLATAACGTDDPGPSMPLSPSVQTSVSVNPSPAQSGAATALDAYRGMWKAYVDALRIPDSSHPDLQRFIHGDALTLFKDGLAMAERDGLVGEGDVNLSPSVVAAKPNATPPTVDINDCVDTSQTRLVKKDGSLYQDTPGGKRKAVVTAARMDDGLWKVISFALLDVGTCS
jgi:hypothetical protein